ncbi:MAG: paraquat-inducible protein A [Burkholderiales bacterium]
MQHVACRGCDLLQRVPALPPGAKARCRRCGQLVAYRAADPLDAPLALAVASVVTLGIANTSELMSLSAAGRVASTTLLGGSLAMWEQGNEVTAVVVGLCAVVAPIAYVLLLLTVLVAVRFPPAPRWTADLMRWVERVRPWSMTEVLLLGILVALTKISQLATVSTGPGMYAVVALVVLLPWLASSFDAQAVWSRIRWAADEGARS